MECNEKLTILGYLLYILPTRPSSEKEYRTKVSVGNIFFEELAHGPKEYREAFLVDQLEVQQPPFYNLKVSQNAPGCLKKYFKALRLLNESPASFVVLNGYDEKIVRVTRTELIFIRRNIGQCEMRLIVQVQSDTTEHPKQIVGVVPLWNSEEKNFEDFTISRLEDALQISLGPNEKVSQAFLDKKEKTLKAFWRGLPVYEFYLFN